MRIKNHITVLFGVVIAVALILSAGLPFASSVNADPGVVDIVIVPTPCTVAVNQVFTVDIRLVAGSVPVRGAEAHINFNATYLEVQNVTLGTTLNNPIEYQFNNTVGTIDCAAGKLTGTLPTGNITLATIQLKAKAVIASTPLTFIFDNATNRKTDVITKPVASVLGTVTDGVVTIQPLGILNGHVDLQMRPTAPDPTWATPLTVKFFFPNGTIARTENVTTDDWGNFTIADVASGTYNIGVKCPRSLSELVTGVIFSVASTTEVSFGTLREGDANNNDVIEGGDYSWLYGDYNENSGPALDRCDFDRSGMVGSFDLSLLKTNFNQIGDMYGM